MLEMPSYYGILPATVRYDSNLNMSEKVLYTELSALTNKYGYCFASNSYFAGLYKVTTGTVSGWFSSLEKAGHVRTEVDKMAGNKRKVWTIVKNNYRSSEKPEDPYSEKPEDINTTRDNTKKEYNGGSTTQILPDTAKEKKEPPSKEVKKKYSEFVRMTEKEYKKLVDDYGEKIAKDFIERLNDYIGSKGKRYKSHYYTILNWMRRDGIKKDQFEKPMTEEEKTAARHFTPRED